MRRFNPRALSGRVFSTFVVLTSLSLLGSMAVARDADGAKKNIDAAKKDIADGEMDKATTDIQLAEAELDGITDAAAKSDLTKQVADLKKQMSDTTANAANADLIKKLDFHLKSLKDYLTDHDGFAAELKETQDLLSADGTKTALGDAKIADYQKQITPLVKVEKQKHAAKAKSDAEARLKDAEDHLADFKKQSADPNGSTFDKQTDIQSIQGSTKQVGFIIKGLPSDDPAVVALTARAKALDDAVAGIENAGAAADVIDHITSYWDGHKQDYEGWEAETTGPTFDQYTKESSQKMSALNAPKTAALAKVSDEWLKEIPEMTKSAPNDPKVKELVAKVQKLHDDACTKLAKFADAVLTEAEKQPSLNPMQAQKMETLANDDLRLDIPGYSGMDALKTRATALNDKFTKGQAAASAAAEGAAKQLTESAAAAWPGMAAKFSTEDGFDPNKLDSWKGKTVRFKDVNNRMGWDYTGDFDFATRVDGLPVAGKFSPEVRAAFTDVAHKTKQDIDDHHWDVIATVEGPGRMNEQTSADVKVDGENVGKVEGKRPVDCAVIKIIALHAGPVAVAQGQGAVSENGSVATVAGVAAVHSSRGLGHYIACLIGLAGAALAFLKARPQPAGAGGSSLAAVNQNMDVLGLAFAALGVVWLLSGLIYKDFLPAVGLIACGVYVASDLLVARGILPADLAQKLKPLGLPIAVATGVIVLIHVFVGGSIPLL